MGTRSAHGDKAYRAILAGSIAACVALSGTSVVFTHQVMGRMDTVAASAKTRADEAAKARDAASAQSGGSGADSATGDADGSATATTTGGAATTSQAQGPSANEEKNDKTPSTQPDAVASGDDTEDVAAGGGETAAATQAPSGTATPQAAPSAGGAAAPQQTSRQPSVWHVQYGNTLAYISDATGVSVDAIANANQIRDVNRIYADSALAIPD